MGAIDRLAPEFSTDPRAHSRSRRKNSICSTACCLQWGARSVWIGMLEAGLELINKLSNNKQRCLAPCQSLSQLPSG